MNRAGLASLTSASENAECVRLVARLAVDNATYWAGVVAEVSGLLSVEHAYAEALVREATAKLLATYGAGLAVASGVPS